MKRIIARTLAAAVAFGGLSLIGGCGGDPSPEEIDEIRRNSEGSVAAMAADFTLEVV